MSVQQRGIVADFLANEINMDSTYFHIGLNDIEEEGVWMFSDGELFSDASVDWGWGVSK